MSKKLLIFVIVVFLIGLIGGAYLVLRSTVTRGELANSTPVSQGKSSDELLGELLKLNQLEQSGANKEYVPPEERNLTDGFLETIVSEIDKNGGLSQKSVDRLSGSDFMANSVIPYLSSSEMELFPNIPDSVLKIVSDTKAARQNYFKKTNKDAVAIFNVISDFIKLNPDDIENDNNVFNKLNENKTGLADAFENLSAADVPKGLTETHKKMMLVAFSAQKSIEALLASDEDPLKTLVIFNEIEEVGNFWKDALTEYDSASKGK